MRTQVDDNLVLALSTLLQSKLLTTARSLQLVNSISKPFFQWLREVSHTLP